MTDHLALAAEFPPTSQAEWRKLVEAALKGASFEKRLVSQTYDGLRVEPLYPRAAGAKPVAGRTPGAAWTIMQRIDHPDPTAANAQALQDLENGATGLTLVFAGSLNANGYGLDASPDTLARLLDGVELDAGITIDFNLSAATRGAVQLFAALVKERKLSPAAVDMRASLNPIGGFAASGTSPKPWSELSKMFAGAVIRDLAEPRLSRAVRGCRRAHHPQCRRLGSARAFLRACRRRRLPARAGSGRRAARCRARHDLFPACRRRRRVS